MLATNPIPLPFPLLELGNETDENPPPYCRASSPRIEREMDDGVGVMVQSAVNHSQAMVDVRVIRPERQQVGQSLLCSLGISVKQMSIGKQGER